MSYEEGIGKVVKVVSLNIALPQAQRHGCRLGKDAR